MKYIIGLVFIIVFIIFGIYASYGNDWAFVGLNTSIALLGMLFLGIGVFKFWVSRKRQRKNEIKK